MTSYLPAKSLFKTFDLLRPSLASCVKFYVRFVKVNFDSVDFDSVNDRSVNLAFGDFLQRPLEG